MLLWLLVVLLFLLVVVDGCCGCLERTLGGDTQFQSWRSRWCPSTPATSFRDVCKWIETCLRQWETGLWWSFHRGSDLSYEERGAWVRYRFLSGIHRRQASSARPINLCWWVVLSCHVLFYLKQRIKLRTAKQTTPHHTTQHHTTPHHTTPHNTTQHHTPHHTRHTYFHFPIIPGFIQFVFFCGMVVLDLQIFSQQLDYDSPVVSIV